MSDKKSPDPSELKIALDNRAFEIQLFWQRSNYFLVLMTALGIGTFSVKDPVFSPIIALFSTACSYFWFRTNLGSKFWQESWEVEVSELSKELGVRSFERPIGEVRAQVAESLRKGQKSEKRGFLRVWIDRLTVKKYSVTYNMILLSFLSTIVWLIVAIVLVVRSVNYHQTAAVPGATSSALQPHAANPTPRRAPVHKPQAILPSPSLVSNTENAH